MLSGTGEMRWLSSGNAVAPAEHGTPQSRTERQWTQVQTHCLPAAGIHCALISARLTLSAYPTHTICSLLTFECAMTPCLEHLLPGWCCRLRSSDTLLRSYWWRWVTGDRVFGSDLHLKLSLFFFHFHFFFFAFWLQLQCSQPLAVVQQSRWTILLHITSQSNLPFPQVVSCSMFLQKNGNSK